jgi:RNA polymerase sigma-70 factor (ECF subfamily)
VGAPLDPDRFCRALSPRLVGSLVLFCGDRGLAEELAQEALARAFERWDRVSRMDAPEAWVYRTAFNLARTQGRRRTLERRAQRQLALAPAPALPDSATAVALRDAVAALPPRQRAAVVARFYAGLSVAQAATALGCAPGTVKALVHQGVARLRESGLVDEALDGHDDEEAEEEPADARAD